MTKSPKPLIPYAGAERIKVPEPSPPPRLPTNAEIIEKVIIEALADCMKKLVALQVEKEKLEQRLFALRSGKKGQTKAH